MKIKLFPIFLVFIIITGSQKQLLIPATPDPSPPISFAEPSPVIDFIDSNMLFGEWVGYFAEESKISSDDWVTWSD